MKPLLLINVVGLAWRHLGTRTPHLSALCARGGGAPMTTILPAVTCSAQATLLTGRMPRDHGVVGNGWLFRDTQEVRFWQQASHLMKGERLFESARRRDPACTTAQLFWWFNMGAPVDWSITPRPFYPADGRKLMGVYGTPPSFPAQLEEELGSFPFFDFWGPKAGLPSSQWIADAAVRTLAIERPGLTLVYLPHLDYDHQRFGPDAPRSLDAIAEVDTLVGQLVAAADAAGATVAVVSEYAIEEARRPIYLNRSLREAGLLAVRPEPPGGRMGERLDPFASRAFAVVDHQVAHVYVEDPADLARTKQLLASTPGVEQVLDPEAQAACGIDHPRTGEFVLVAEAGAWFAYPFWLDDKHAPDFARTVAIHDKPGYDPCELLLDPALKLPMARVARRLAQKKLGLRYLMDVIPLDASLVRGSHGRLPDSPERGPVFLSSEPFDAKLVEMTSVKERLLKQMGLGAEHAPE